MWVSQTYLGDGERDAKYYVYYLFEDYNTEQKELTKSIQLELENLGEVYGEKVSLLMPNPRYANRIESEVRQFSELWMAIEDYLPGVLLSPAPLAELDISHKECKFVPMRNDSPEHLERVIAKIRKHADYALCDEGQPSNWIGRLVDALELKPNFGGIGIDLKKLLAR
jgi:hypothetical protein